MRELAHVDEAVLVHADVHEGAERGDVRDQPGEDHALLQVLELRDVVAEARLLEALPWIPAGLLELGDDVAQRGLAAALVHVAAELDLAHQLPAADEAGGFRATYDLVMKWVNFGILVVLFLKFGKKPLMEFLRGRKSEIAQEIGKIEAEREKVAETLLEAKRALEASEQRLDEIRRRISA